MSGSNDSDDEDDDNVRPRAFSLCARRKNALAPAPLIALLLAFSPLPFSTVQEAGWALSKQRPCRCRYARTHVERWRLNSLEQENKAALGDGNLMCYEDVYTVDKPDKRAEAGATLGEDRGNTQTPARTCACPAALSQRALPM